MAILCGHPTGNPNSHNAALAYYEAGVLESFCTPWMPSSSTIDVFGYCAPFRPLLNRLRRRQFAPLESAPKIQDPVGELQRLILRGLGWHSRRFSDAANHW